MKLTSILKGNCFYCDTPSEWGAWSYHDEEYKPLCPQCIYEKRGLEPLEFTSRAEEREFYDEE